MVNELGLKDDAFHPKSFTVSIENGSFKQPCFIGGDESMWSRYALRLFFDKSPYPPRCEWKEPEGGPDSGQFWDHKEFVGRSSPELSKKGRAMNDLPAAGWNFCVVS